MQSDDRTDLNTQRTLIDSLLDSSRYPHAARNIRVVETHISWVLLAGRYVYKIKKAVDLGFLDFMDLSSRRHYCEEELRLNRRLAPQIYLDVIAVGGAPDNPVLNTLPAIDYAVRMKRFPASRELDRLATRGKLLPEHMDSLAATIAHFHQGMPQAQANTDFGSAGSVHAAVSDVFDQLQAVLKDGKDKVAATHLRRAMETEYASLRDHFIQRRIGGFIRECHGDLHLGNMVLMDEQPVPFDGIEFSPALRWIDVMSEVAFTVMDLLRFRQPGLAYRFLNAYLEITGDYSGISLLRYYVAYRATVRAMVSAIRAGQTNLSGGSATKALAESRDFLALAREYLAQRRSALIITHGLPGSGKSTFAQAALERFQGIRIRSDVERKRLFGLGALSSSRSQTDDIYGADATQRTYKRLHELARELLTSGFPVVVDAAFLRRDERSCFQELAHELRVPFAIVSIRADTSTLRARIIQRQNAAKDASEAGLDVLDLLRDKQETLSRLEYDQVVEFVNEEPGFSASNQAWCRLTEMLSIAE